MKLFLETTSADQLITAHFNEISLKSSSNSHDNIKALNNARIRMLY